MRISQIARRSGQAGLTLIEMLVALAVAALVVAGALAMFSMTSSSQAATKFAADLTAVRTGIRKAFYGHGYGTGSLTEPLINARIIPTSWEVTGSAPTRTVRTPFGVLTVTGISSGARFQVTVAGVPSAVCTSVMANSAGWESVTIGSNPTRTLPVSLDTAAADCGSAATVSMTLVGF